MALSTNFKDDILNESVNTKRKYNVIHNNDGTESYEDVTSYSQTGSQYGAKEVNEEREAINKLTEDVSSLKLSLGNLKFVKQEFYNVGTEYSDDNRIRYNGDTISAGTFPSSAWLIVLNGTEITGSGSMFLALPGTVTPNMEIIELGKNQGTYPVLKKTDTSGLLYVAWSNTRNAYIAANIFKLS